MNENAQGEGLRGNFSEKLFFPSPKAEVLARFSGFWNEEFFGKHGTHFIS